MGKKDNIKRSAIIAPQGEGVISRVDIRSKVMLWLMHKWEHSTILIVYSKYQIKQRKQLLQVKINTLLNKI